VRKAPRDEEPTIWLRLYAPDATDAKPSEARTQLNIET
jgi:hypothetical protein